MGNMRGTSSAASFVKLEEKQQQRQAASRAPRGACGRACRRLPLEAAPAAAQHCRDRSRSGRVRLV